MTLHPRAPGPQMALAKWLLLFIAFSLVACEEKIWTRSPWWQRVRGTETADKFENWLCPSCWSPPGVPQENDTVLVRSGGLYLGGSVPVGIRGIFVGPSGVFFCRKCSLRAERVVLAQTSHMIIGDGTVKARFDLMDASMLYVTGRSTIVGDVGGMGTLDLQLSPKSCERSRLAIRGNLALRSPISIEGTTSQMSVIKVNGSILNNLRFYLNPIRPFRKSPSAPPLITWTGTAKGFRIQLLSDRHCDTCPSRTLVRQSSKRSDAGDSVVECPCLSSGPLGGPGNGKTSSSGGGLPPTSLKECSGTGASTGGSISFDIILRDSARGGEDSYSSDCKVECPPNRIGPDCAPHCPPLQGLENNCNQRGKCASDDNSQLSYCKCNSGWTGSDCTVRAGSCPKANSLECNGPLSGTCEWNAAAGVGKCMCRAGWTGTDCGTPVCDPPCASGLRCLGATHTCGVNTATLISLPSGQPSPTPTATKTSGDQDADEDKGAEEEEEGRPYDVETSPSQSSAPPASTKQTGWLYVPPTPRASQSSTASSSSCDLRDWAANCELPICNGQTELSCSGAGYCRSDRTPHYCECLDGFEGVNCEHVSCDESRDCNGHGSCIVDRVPAECNCYAGWFGSRCNLSTASGALASVQRNGTSSQDVAAAKKSDNVNIVRTVVPIVVVVTVVGILVAVAFVFRSQIQLPKITNRRKGEGDVALLANVN